jgi:hypothetical protein
MRMPRLLGIVATAFLALGLGIGVGGAAVSGHHASSDITQDGANQNGTSQWDDSNANTAQANADRAFSEHGKDDGGDHWKGDRKDHGSDASQSNDAWTSSKSGNDNATKQSLKQDQWVKIVDFFEKHHGDDWKDCGCDSKGDGSNGNGWKGQDTGSSGNVSQHGSNDNWTDQRSASNAKTYQANVFAPSGSGGGGHVDQSNHAKTSADAPNSNRTDQSLHQKQAVSDDKGQKGKDSSGDVSQKGSNDNHTSQDARSEATTKQVNIYAPISIWGKGSGKSDVTQSNTAWTTATSSNSNWTDQSLGQDQEFWGSGHTNVSQYGHNSNSTNQSSVSRAKTVQVNIYAPISVGEDGGGSVHQDNTGDTNASSNNSNGTGQNAGQQEASSSGHG